MTVYVDPALHRYRGQLYCHVWADDIDELHAAAQSAGLKRAWFQEPPAARWMHYDAGPAVRARLIANGAVETDRYGAIEHLARQRGDGAMLWRIATLRIRHRAARRAECPVHGKAAPVPRPTDAEFEELKRLRAAAVAPLIDHLCELYGWDKTRVTVFHSLADPCYCACPTGPCQHVWDGPEFAEEDLSSATCSRCGAVAAFHDARCAP